MFAITRTAYFFQISKAPRASAGGRSGGARLAALPAEAFDFSRLIGFEDIFLANFRLSSVRCVIFSGVSICKDDLIDYFPILISQRGEL